MSKECFVTNRSAGAVVYSIPEEGIRRSFQPNETKKIKFEELEKLTYQTGGRELLEQYLQVIDEETINDLNVHAEPEYYMNAEQVKQLLLSGSNDELLDALDYAPIGVLDLIKQLSVSLPLNDVSKRKIIKDKTGFDVTASLIHIEETKEVVETQEKPQRRVKKNEEIPAGRRTVPKYKRVEK